MTDNESADRQPECPDCGLKHPGLMAWNLTRYSCKDPVHCIRALAAEQRKFMKQFGKES
jgi:hypothetical protein